MSEPLSQAPPVGREALFGLPDTVVGEVIGGVLYTAPRPRRAHAEVAAQVSAVLRSAHFRAKGAPGGWVILVEPGVELEGAAEIVPDVAGWRSERVAHIGGGQAFNVVPDWICEILSPSTRVRDTTLKMPVYAAAGVRHAWLVEPLVRMVTVYENVGGRWALLETAFDDAVVRLAPFSDTDMDLGNWWVREPGA